MAGRPESLAGSHGQNRSAGKPDRAEQSTWRASEMYENKVKNADKARAAYGRVPPTSSHYKDAQKKLTKVKNYKAKGKRQKLNF